MEWAYDFSNELVRNDKLAMLREMLDDFILVSEKEISHAIVLHLEMTHNLAEHAGASPLAAAVKIKEQLRGKKIILVMSGGNITVQQLRAAIS